MNITLTPDDVWIRTGVRLGLCKWVATAPAAIVLRLEPQHLEELVDAIWKKLREPAQSGGPSQVPTLLATR